MLAAISTQVHASAYANMEPSVYDPIVAENLAEDIATATPPPAYEPIATDNVPELITTGTPDIDVTDCVPVTVTITLTATIEPTETQTMNPVITEEPIPETTEYSEPTATDVPFENSAIALQGLSLLSVFGFLL